MPDITGGGDLSSEEPLDLVGPETHAEGIPFSTVLQEEDDLWREVEARNRRALFTGELAGQSTPRY